MDARNFIMGRMSMFKKDIDRLKKIKTRTQRQEIKLVKYKYVFDELALVLDTL